ncbi:MAG TPA: triple tyrosine motif-containing protein [Verrucomicrobiae bacterium]|nr:triple tyrosine motif-containing protein [Verrucomicrobiae bacterium]
MASPAIQFRRFFLAAILICILRCADTLASTDTNTWFTRSWNTYDGLLNDQIGAIAQGRDGYLWVVPPVGLMRFDGVNFSRFPLENYTSPADNHIGTVLQSRAGIFWIGMYGGTVIGLKPDFTTVTVPQANLPKSTPFGLAEDQEGSLWLAYANVVCRIKDGHVARYATAKGMPIGQFHSLISDGAGNIWLAKGNQICVFRDDHFEQIATQPEVRKLAATPTNAVWAIAGAHLLRCDTSGELLDQGALPGIANARGAALLEDDSGAVWIGTDGDGLFRFDGNGFEKIETSYPSILGLAEDGEGNIWAGTFGGGLDRISLSAVRLETLEVGGALERVQSICEDANGGLWGAAYSGFPYRGLLVSYVNGKWTPAFTNSPFSGAMTCVAADNNGAVWIGTVDGKLLRLKDQGLVLVQSTPDGAISALQPSSNGDVWIIGAQRLQYFHDGQLREVQLPRQIRRISAATEDAAGNLWLAAWDIVLRFDGTNIIDESPHLPIAGRRVNTLYETPDGSMWMSGGGLGLLRYKNGRADCIGTGQGLLDDYIAQIVIDSHGWLWCAGDHGIFKVQLHELEEAAQDHNFHLRPVAYGQNEGLPSLAALVSIGVPFALPHSLYSHDRRVWLLTKMGVVAADPKLLPAVRVPPSALLTRVAMDGQIIASYAEAAPTQTVANLATLDQPLQLPPSHRHLEFDYTAFYFSAPENLRFRYQLTGFDTGWIDGTADRHADYSRLTPGNYQFNVEACVGDGPWSIGPATVSFTVAPFFWQTWWFRLSWVLLLALAGIAIVRYIFVRRLTAQMRQLEQRAALDRERTRIARDLHDDLGGSLNLAALTLDMTQREQGMGESLNGKIRHCSTIVRQAAKSVDEIVWAINPRNDTFRYLVDYLSQFAVEFLQAADILCLVELPDEIPDWETSPEARHNLLLVVKEALNNIVRHARATEVCLRVTISQNQLNIVIQDNGRGFENPPDNTTCDGLRNMRQRMEEIGGRFELDSRPGAGTRIALLYSWPLHS